MHACWTPPPALRHADAAAIVLPALRILCPGSSVVPSGAQHAAMKATFVRYRIKPEHVEHNEQLIRAVFDALAQAPPPGLQYC